MANENRQVTILISVIARTFRNQMLSALLRARFLRGCVVSFCIGQFAVGCGGEQAVIEQLDTSTGLTILSDSQPLVFARAEMRYSVSGRDYIYLGPVETNQQGTRDYFLWVGLASTLDRGYLAPDAEVPDMLFIETNDEIFDFKLHPWTAPSSDVSDNALYSTAVPVQSEFAARATLNQLAVLTAEPVTSIRITDGAGVARRYNRWTPERDWSGFLERVQATTDR